jgi:hypothetical protein
MYRRTMHRGIAALALVTFLAVAGAQPAMAASDAGFLDRLAGLWSSVVGGEPETLWHRLTGWAGGKPAGKAPRATVKRGWGIDPNGRAVVVEEPTDPVDGSNTTLNNG